MQKLMKILGFICLVASFLFYAQLANAQNRLVNIDFETGDISGWARWAISDEVSSEENHTPDGQHSYNPSLNEPQASFEMGALIQEFEDIAPGSKIDASCWIKTENLRGPSDSSVHAILKLEFWQDDEIIATDEAGKLTDTNDWTKATISTTVPEGTTKAKYLLMLWNGGGLGSEGEAYFDDVSMMVSSY